VPTKFIDFGQRDGDGGEHVALKIVPINA